MKKIILCVFLLAVTTVSWAGDRETIRVLSSNPFTFAELMKNPGAGNVTLKATLEFPSTAKGKLEKIPAMVFVHGSGGPLPRHQKWLKLFRDMGYATVYANHFAPRGVSSTTGNQSSVSYAMMTADALHLLNALVKHPRIDPNRIGIMGGSKGGGVAYYVAWNPLREAVAKDNKFAASIPLYPPCYFWEKKDFTNKPMLMMIGDKDNYTGYRQCVRSIKENQSAGYNNMQVKLYKGAYHAFDSNKGIRKCANCFNFTQCKLAVRSDGMFYERTTGITMDKVSNMKKVIKSCGKRGTTNGGNHVMSEAMQDVREFLTRALTNAVIQAWEIPQQIDPTSYCYDQNNNEFYFGAYRDPWNKGCSRGDTVISLDEYIHDELSPTTVVMPVTKSKVAGKTKDYKDSEPRRMPPCIGCALGPGFQYLQKRNKNIELNSGLKC